MTTKFTPGKWEAGPPATGLDPLRQRYIHASGELVAQAYAGYIHFDDAGGKYWNINAQTLEANANLIAAAPELLEALKDLVDACDGNYRELTVECQKVIAKAEGRQ